MTAAAILALVVQMVPVVEGLISTLQKIKSQTQADHPDVWAKVSSDFGHTAEAWNNLIAK